VEEIRCLHASSGVGDGVLRCWHMERERKEREGKRREEDDEREQNRRVERVETKVSVGECGLKGSVGRTKPQ
jgi:urease alpha subunit